MPAFTHIDHQGQVRMVDVSAKEPTLRVAVAQGVISMDSATFENIYRLNIKKGNVLETARIAGLMAAKRTSELIPMCHPLNMTHVEIEFYPNKKANSIRIEATVRIIERTGVEMEALTAVSVAALTIYDMCKSYDRAMCISNVYLLEKSGGKSGTFVRENNN